MFDLLYFSSSLSSILLCHKNELDHKVSDLSIERPRAVNVVHLSPVKWQLAS